MTIETTIQEYNQTAAALSTLRERYAGATFDVESTDGLKQAKEARAEVRGYRTSLEAKRKEIKGPALERCRLIDEEARRITEELRELEDPIDSQIKVLEARKEAEKQAKIEAELKRVESHQARIAEIRGAVAAVNTFGNPSSEKVADFISDVEVLSTDGMEEFEEQAKDAKTSALATLRELHAAAIDREAEQERIRQERAELERLRAEQAEREAKERAEREAKEAADRAKREAKEAKERAKREAEAKKERERMDAERKAQEAERKKLAAEQAKLDAERRAIEEQKERERKAKEKAEREAAERKRKAEAAAKKAKFPGVDAIVSALCESFDVSESVARQWIEAIRSRNAA